MVEVVETRENLIDKYRGGSTFPRLDKVNTVCKYTGSEMNLKEGVELYILDIISSTEYRIYKGTNSCSKVDLKEQTIHTVVNMQQMAMEYSCKLKTLGDVRYYIMTSIFDSFHESLVKDFLSQPQFPTSKVLRYISIEDISNSKVIDVIKDYHKEVYSLSNTENNANPDKGPRLSQNLPELVKGRSGAVSHIPSDDIIHYTQSKVTDNRPYIQFLKQHNQDSVDPLRLISPGNMYIFLDCEYTVQKTAKDKVKEISLICAVMGTVFLEPVASLQCRESTPVATCSQFLLTFPKFLAELKEQYKVGSVYFIGHSMIEDLRYIYSTLGLNYDESYQVIDTGTEVWQKYWLDLLPYTPVGDFKVALGDLMTQAFFTPEKMNSLTKTLYGPGEYKIHTSMFDTTLLFILVSLLLAKREDEALYRELHFLLLNDKSHFYQPPTATDFGNSEDDNTGVV